METQKRSVIRKVYPDKDPWSHKGEYGKLLIISGSRVFTGAPVIIGMSALRSGVDTVFFAGPKRSMDVVANHYPTFINLSLDCDYIEKPCLDHIFDFAEEMKITGLAIGPGLWRTPKTREAVLKIIEGFDVPMVIDADAVRAVGDNVDVLNGKKAILTPHSDEFRELTGVKLGTKIGERAEAVRHVAKETGSVVILKGNTDIISDGKKISANKTGNVYMTKGGFGDMLVGICGSLISRRKNKVDIFDAACAAAYINGKAGDLAGNEKHEGLIVTDAIEKIPEVIGSG